MKIPFKLLGKQIQYKIWILFSWPTNFSCWLQQSSNTIINLKAYFEFESPGQNVTLSYWHTVGLIWIIIEYYFIISPNNNYIVEAFL